ncbi:MAG TPA: homoserine dehydrogenase [Nitrospinae bacterium]|nr:homoserine dehydrogenase [Nitrospinota bacterium]
MKSINIGLLGFGTVGTGVVKILQQNSGVIGKRLGAKLNLKWIADLDIERDRGVKVDKNILTKDASKVLNDPEVNIVIELIGGYEPAKRFILKALNNKKHVVTANKALLAKHGSEIFETASKNNADIGFEASVGGGIPIIRAIKEGFTANNIQSVYGIVNGTCNYILSKMSDEGRQFDEVLKEAQALGFAEANPSLDIDGIDSAHKVTILSSIAFGVRVDFDKVYTEGISRITPIDINFAREFGYRIKLLAITKRSNNEIEVRVHPTMVKEDNPISKVNGVLNAIEVTGDAVGENMLIGRGAGDMPTGSAVVGDVIEISRNILNGGVNRVSPLSFLPKYIEDAKIKNISNIISEYYIRFSVLDKPGVLSKISGVLGNNSISISSVIQKGRGEKGGVPLVVMTHSAKEKDIQKALSEIDKLDVVLDKSVLIRVENGERG